MELEKLIELISKSITENFCQSAPVTESAQSQNDGKASSSFSMFQGATIPTISLHEYLLRLATSNISGEALILALIYVNHLSMVPNFVITAFTVHRVVLASVVIAAKYFDDDYLNNACFAKLGGVPTPELNNLEIEVLYLLNFNLYVPGYAYNAVFRLLQAASTKEITPAAATKDIMQAASTKDIFPLLQLIFVYGVNTEQPSEVIDDEKEKETVPKTDSKEKGKDEEKEKEKEKEKVAVIAESQTGRCENSQNIRKCDEICACETF